MNSTLTDPATAERLAVAEDLARTNYSREGLADQTTYTVESMVKYFTSMVAPGTRFYLDHDLEQTAHYVVVAVATAKVELKRRADEASQR